MVVQADVVRALTWGFLRVVLALVAVHPERLAGIASGAVLNMDRRLFEDVLASHFPPASGRSA